MTPADLEAIRRRAWDECADDSMDIATSDRAELLGHVDALQAQLDEARSSVDAWVYCHDDWHRQMTEIQAEVERLRGALRAIDARHLLAWQQARVGELKADHWDLVIENAKLSGSHSGLRMYRTAWERELRNAGARIAVKAGGLIDELVAGTKDLGAQIATLRSERDAARAEVERLKAQVKALAEDLAGIVYNHDEHGHVDASWFDSARAQLAAISEREAAS